MITDKSLSILHVIMGYSPHIGGAERQAQIQAETQEILGHKVGVFTQRMPNTKRYEIINNIVIQRFGWSEMWASKEVTSFFIIISLLFNHKKYDIIQVHQAHFLALLVSFLCFCFKIPCFIKVANSGSKFDLKILLERYILGRYLLKILIKSKPNYIAISPSIRDELIEYGIDKNSIYDIPNGVKIYYLSYSDIPNYKNNKEIKKVVFIGRLEKIKRPLFIIQIASLFDQNVEFHLYGNGTFYDEAIVNINKLSLTNCFVHGITNNVRSVLKSSDALILPSVTEGMSNAILEALAHGVPIIASRISQNKYLLSNCGNKSAAILIDSDNPVDWKIQINNLLQDKRSYTNYSKNAFNKSLEYDIKAISKRYVNMYLSHL
jgi:L-malate glycosyltransferase